MISAESCMQYIILNIILIISLLSDNQMLGHTVCPVSSDPFYVVTYYIKWVTTYWTHSIPGFMQGFES